MSLLRDVDAQLPLGCNIKTLNYRPLAILNCSHLPMNPAFYPCTLSADEQLQVHTLAAIKQSLAQNSINTIDQESLQFINSDVFKDFAVRLNQVLAQAAHEIIIVPCGHTARGFVSAFITTYAKPLTILHGLPHPTEPEWRDKINTISLTDHIALQLLP